MKTALQKVRVIDGRGGVHERATVVIEDTRILSLDATGRAPLPPAARKVDLGGMTLLPGLIDCHVHLCLGAEPDVVQTIRDESPSLTLLKAAEFARRTLEAGFTTV